MSAIKSNLLEELCREVFCFLIDMFDFAFAGSERDAYGEYVAYKSGTTGVKISYEPREGGIFVSLSRLVGNEFPEHERFIGYDTVINSFDLLDLIAIRDPAFKINEHMQDIFNPCSAEMRLILHQYAEALQRYASDILRGDFSIFPELERIVKDRAQQMNAE